MVGEKRLDNVTSKFYTYDASKISVGSIPPGFVGMPVEFESKFNDVKFEFQTHSISCYSLHLECGHLCMNLELKLYH